MYEYLITWLSLKTDRRGVTALEYGLIAAVIAGTVVVGFGTLGTNLSAAFTSIAGKV